MAQEKLFFGGQAVIEGVMIRGPRFYAVACRRQDGSIEMDSGPVRSSAPKMPILRRIPVLRGLFAMAEMLGLGFRTLEWSANLQIEEIEGPQPEKPKALVLGSMIVAVLAMMTLLIFLPTSAAGWLSKWLSGWFPGLAEQPILLNLIEGGIRLLIMVGYIASIGFMKEIRRVFSYHGAEHKVVNTFEAGEPIEVDSVRPFGLIHPRCGTTFLFFVIVVKFIVFAFLPWEEVLWLRVLWRILLLPLVIGLSFELIRLSGRFGRKGPFSVLISPGLALQKLTTREPTDDMIQVAITSFEKARELELAAQEQAEEEDVIPFSQESA